MRLAASTAEGAAALRAAGARERDRRVRGPDRLAERLVPGGLRLTALVKVPLLRAAAPRLAERIMPGSYWYEIARVRHMDALLRTELEAGAHSAFRRYRAVGALPRSRCPSSPPARMASR